MDSASNFKALLLFAALLAGAVILFNGYRIFRAALGEIMDAAVPNPIQKEIRELSAAVPGVVRVEKCRTRKSGLGLIVEIHVEGDDDLTVRRGHEIAHDVTNLLKSSTLSVQDVMVHVEPALIAPAHPPPRQRQWNWVGACHDGPRHHAAREISGA